MRRIRGRWAWFLCCIKEKKKREEGRGEGKEREIEEDIAEGEDTEDTQRNHRLSTRLKSDGVEVI